MAKSLQTSGIFSGTGGTTSYEIAGVTYYGQGATTESNSHIPYQTAGTLANLTANLKSNTCTGTSTIKTRKNASDGAQALSIAATTTGIFEDVVNSDSIASTDNVAIQYSGGTANGLAGLLSTTFDAGSVTVIHWVTTVLTGSYNTASTTYFMPVAGDDLFNLGGTTEGPNKMNCPIAGTLQKMYMKVPGNTHVGNTTVRSRVNGANGGISVSITALTTGVFTDYSGTDALVAGDDINYSITVAAGESGSLSIYFIATEFATTEEKFISLSGDTIGTAFNNATAYWYIGSGAIDGQTSEAVTMQKMRMNARASNLFLNVSANTHSVADTVAFRVNNTTRLLISIPASTTGQFENTDFFNIKKNDSVNFQLIAANGTGSIKIFIAAITFAVLTGSTPGNMYRRVWVGNNMGRSESAT